MKVSEIFDKNCVLLNIDAHNKDDIFEAMANQLIKLDAIRDKEEFKKALYDRESAGETGIGEGIAIPHGISDTVLKPTVLYVKSVYPIKYESLDDLPVDTFFMLAIPKNSSKEHLKLLSSIACLLMEDDFKNKIKMAKSEEDIVKAVKMSI